MVLIITNAATAHTEVALTLAAQWVGFSRELLFVSCLEERNAFLQALGTVLSPSKGDQARWLARSREVAMAGDALPW